MQSTRVILRLKDRASLNANRKQVSPRINSVGMNGYVEMGFIPLRKSKERFVFDDLYFTSNKYQMLELFISLHLN